MRVALVGPELEENLALRYIHATVQRSGHVARIFDLHAARQIPALAAAVRQFDPHVVGLSMVFTARAAEFIRLAEQLRAAGYVGHITAGGHFATFHATELLRDDAAIDSIIHGEGEQALVQLLDNLDRPESVDGLSYRNAAGDIQCTERRQNPPDLNALPWPTRPDRFHDYLGLPIANMLSGRGCFANCHFCSINAWHRRNGGRRFRQRNIADVVDEMAGLYHDRGVRIFNFHDDNFFLPTRPANLKRLTEMRRQLARRGVGRIGFQIKARPDSVDPDVMSLLCDLGLFRVFLGVETNSVAGLVTLGRGIDRRQNHRALKILKRLGVHTCFNLLMFDPETRPEDLRQNIDFMRSQCEWPLNFCRTEIYAGTELERRMRAEDRLEGSYLGYSYRIRDPRVQLAFEMFCDVFTPRNFADDGLNHQAMKLDYYLHILHHFWPQHADRSLLRQAKGLTGRLNRNSADLLDAILRLATSPTEPNAADVRRLVEECAAQRARCDAQLAAEIQELLQRIRELAGRPERSGRRGNVFTTAASVAAAVAIAVSSGCSRPDDTHMHEMAPAPSEPDKTPPSEPPAISPPDDTHFSEMAPWPMEPDAQPVPELPSDETHMCEEAPEPIDPTPAPIDAPAAEPADGDQAGVGGSSQPAGLAWDESRCVEQTIRDRHRAELESVAAGHLDGGSTVRVALQFDTTGRVAKYGVEWPPHAPALEAELRDVLAAWSFPFLRQGGLCTLAVTLTAGVASEPPTTASPSQTHPHERVSRPIETHPTEMVAPPIGPTPVKPPLKIEPLPADLVTKIQHEIEQKHWPAIESMAAKHLPEDQRQTLPAVDLFVSAQGNASVIRIGMKPDAHPQFQQALRAEIGTWRFPFVKRSGLGTVSLRPPVPEPLPGVDVRKINLEIHSKHRRELFELTTKHLPREVQSKRVSVDIELDGAGKVVKHTIRMGKGEHVDYQRALGKLISQWQFPWIKQPGTCTVQVDPIGMFNVKPPERPDIHMHERVPTPIRPRGR